MPPAARPMIMLAIGALLMVTGCGAGFPAAPSAPSRPVPSPASRLPANLCDQILPSADPQWQLAEVSHSTTWSSERGTARCRARGSVAGSRKSRTTLTAAFDSYGDATGQQARDRLDARLKAECNELELPHGEEDSSDYRCSSTVKTESSAHVVALGSYLTDLSFGRVEVTYSGWNPTGVPAYVSNIALAYVTR